MWKNNLQPPIFIRAETGYFQIVVRIEGDDVHRYPLVPRGFQHSLVEAIVLTLEHSISQHQFFVNRRVAPIGQYDERAPPVDLSELMPEHLVDGAIEIRAADLLWMNQLGQRQQRLLTITGPIQLLREIGIKRCDRNPILRPQIGDEAGDGSLHDEPFVLSTAAPVKQEKNVVGRCYRTKVAYLLASSIFVYLKSVLR